MISYIPGRGKALEPEKINYLSVGFGTAHVVDDYYGKPVNKEVIATLQQDKRFIRVWGYVFNIANIDDVERDTPSGFSLVSFKDGTSTIIKCKHAKTLLNYIQETPLD